VVTVGPAPDSRRPTLGQTIPPLILARADEAIE
jgi:hypothetical protein